MSEAYHRERMKPLTLTRLRKSLKSSLSRLSSESRSSTEYS
jgi:hypothetical protein